MEKQLKLVEAIWSSLNSNVKQHIENKRKNRSYFNENYLNRNCGKTALRRKITLLRQELLNLGRMLDDERF